MRLKGEAYSERLESFSDGTLQLVADLMGYTANICKKSLDITTDSELTEEQVAERLQALKWVAERQKQGKM